jgi:chemotaxis response regulator CheB
MLIEHDQRMQVVAQAGSRVEALERAASTNPDVIILDLLLGDEDGLSFLPELCQTSPNSRVLDHEGERRRGVDRALDDGQHDPGV